MDHHFNTPTKMKTAEEIAQWVIDNRYAKSENNKIDDRELYDTLVVDIKEYRSQLELPSDEVEAQCDIIEAEFNSSHNSQASSELPSDEEIESLSVKRYRGKDFDEQKRNSKLIIAFEDGMKQMRSIAIASRDARILELEEDLHRINLLNKQYSDFRNEVLKINDEMITILDDKYFPF